MEKGPLLNFDILVVLCSFVNDDELLDISPTCKFFRALALKRILSVVSLETPRQLAGFCNCVLADARTRAPWIRELVVLDGAYPLTRMTTPEGSCTDFGAASSLVTVFKHASLLERLLICRVDEVMKGVAGLEDALKSLPSLILLHLYDIDALEVTFNLLRGLQSNPHDLLLAFSGTSQTTKSLIPKPSPFVKNHTLSLIGFHQILAVTAVGAQICPEDVPASSGETVKWSSVRELRLDGCCVDVLSMNAAFPNVRMLTIKMTDSVIKPGPLWPGIDYLEVHLDTCARWQITCPARRIRLISYTTFDSTEFDEGVTIVSGSRPAVLSLEIMRPQGALEFWNALHASALSLRYLEMTVGVYYVDEISSFLVCHLDCHIHKADDQGVLS